MITGMNIINQSNGTDTCGAASCSEPCERRRLLGQCEAQLKALFPAPSSAGSRSSPAQEMRVHLTRCTAIKTGADWNHPQYGPFCNIFF